MTGSSGAGAEVALYDTHCHLHAEAFDQDRDLVVERARMAGIRAVLAVAEDLDDGLRLLEIADRHAGFVRPALGIHPDRAPLVSDGEVGAMESLIRSMADRLVAVGEVGLDHRPRWDEKARARQADIFRTMIRLARELGLPLTVHSRGAGRRAVELLLEEGMTSAALHAFDGRAVHGETGARAGLCFSIPPSVVRSRVKQKLVVRLPAGALLLETDSPVLGPDAALRNEPMNLRISLSKLAELRDEDATGLARTVAANTERIFPRLVSEPGIGLRHANS